MKEFQKVETITDVQNEDLFFTAHYYPVSDKCALFGFLTEKIARMKAPYMTGMWRVKPIDK